MNQEQATQRRDGGPFLPGDIIGGRIEIVREIGRGGMGIVYEAKDCTTGARVALKTILSRHTENAHAAERFVREIELARSLAHPNIVAVHDVGSENGRLYFTMEYLDGVTLREMLRRRGRLTLKQAAWTLNGISEALAYAHGKGIVHRDLSPENVMILRDHSVRLLDFGIARAMHRPLMTAPGKAMGKAYYIAPEQRRDASSVDGRADLYALGVMFYEMLSGQLPTGYHRLADLVPELPVECDTLVEKTVAPLERRIASVAAFRQLLAACVEARPRSAAGLKGRLALSRRQKLAAVCVAVLLGVLALAAVLLPRAEPGSQFLPAPLVANPPAEPGNPMDALSYVWDAPDTDSPITRLRFAPSPMMGRLFEMEGSGVKAHGFYELGDAGVGQDARILRLKLNSVAMLGGAMFGLNDPVPVEALVRIEGDTMTLATGRKWLEALKPISSTLSIIPNISDDRGVVERMKGIKAAQRAAREAGAHSAPASMQETADVMVVVLKRNGQYADSPYAAHIPARALKQLDAAAYPSLASPLTLKWDESPQSAVLHIGDVPVEFVLIPPGTFAMGNGSGKSHEGETPHQVMITKPFWMGKLEVTQAQWAAVMGSVPSPKSGLDLPADAVSWEDADLFVRRLNRYAQGVRFRLPTEAEWEYASRAGAGTPYFFGSDKSELPNYAWCSVQSQDHVQPVGRLQPNPWGLYDIYGNVSEWCSDWFGQDYYRVSPPSDPQGPQQGTERILRGSTYRDDPRISTSHGRNWFPPNMRRDAIGLRLCAVSS